MPDTATLRQISRGELYAILKNERLVRIFEALVFSISDTLPGDVAAVQGNLNAHIAGTTDVHQASAIGFTPTGGISGNNVQTALAELDTEKQPADATLSALATLAVVADRLIYSTGVDTFALATLTAFARSLLDDPDAVTMRSTLGLGVLATAGDGNKGDVVVSSGGTAWTVVSRSKNASVISQSGFSSDTYVTGSHITVPAAGVRVGSTIRWTLSLSKTAAGTANPTYNIRVGGNASTADTARLSILGAAQTATADVGVLTVLMTVRNVSAAGAFQGTVTWMHSLNALGFANNANGMNEQSGAAFDNTALAGLYIGLSIDAGASAAWTVTQCIAEADW